MTTPTIYNGTEPCAQCGKPIAPQNVPYTKLCASCRRKAYTAHIKRGMAP